MPVETGRREPLPREPLLGDPPLRDGRSELPPEPLPRVTPRGGPGPDASMAELVTHLTHETRRFVELQLELAKMQAVQSLAGGTYDAFKIAVAAALLGLASLCLVIALAIGLSVLFESYWLGVLVTGVLLLIAGAIALWFAVTTSFLLNVIPKDLLRQVRVLSRGNRE